MTEILPAPTQSFLDRSTFHPSVGTSSDWHQQINNHMPMLTSDWTSGHPAHLGGMQDLDVRMFQQASYPISAPQFLPPSMAFNGDGNWTPDMDMGTPSTAAFSRDVTEGYHPTNGGSGGHVHPPTRNGMGSASASPHSQSSSHGEFSPHQQLNGAKNRLRVEERPGLTRSATAPEGPRRPPMSANDVPNHKRSGSDDADEDYLPGEETKLRGRKRQRIPHTAVERRYRENLNAHLDKLRQAVPALASRRSGGKAGEPIHEGVKPSKCEILNGAIEHIGSLDKENKGLKAEAKALRARLDELERWYGNGAHRTSYGT